jgi:hypothetical protein
LELNSNNKKHSPFNLTYHGVELRQYWAPHLEIDLERDRLEYELLQFHDEILDPKPIETQKSAALVMLGVGAWFAKADQEGNATQMEQYNSALTKASDLLGKWQPYDFITAPMDPIDGVGNLVVFAPPAGPYSNVTKPNQRAQQKAFAKGMVFGLQKWLHDTQEEWNFPLSWAFPELIMQDNKTIVDPEGTGYHVIDIVAETKANILLNLRCNAKLDRMRGYPYNRTCCTDYGVKPLVQLVLVHIGLAYLLACVILEIFTLATSRRDDGEDGLTTRWPIFSIETGAFVLALLMCYYADRTQLMAKGEKVYRLCDFFLLCAPYVALALVTIRRSAPASSASKGGEVGPAPAPAQPLLSRDQTEEWKGWMQFVILAYHWSGASKSMGVYILIRVIVAAYLFQTGWGHTTFFLVKADFSFRRAAAVLLRLNLLSLSLAYFMNTDYMFYYFSPLVSFWFVIVYLTMRVGHERYNADTQLLLAKIFLSAALVGGIVLATPLAECIFWVLRTFCNIRWNLEGWEFRVGLDLFVVYAGMLAAVAYLRCNVIPGRALRFSAATLGLCAMAAYGGLADKIPLREYQRWHPYVSIVPILGFIAVRNVSATVRNYHSMGMAWLGRCSLETYTLQFHLFLAADTKGVLLIDLFRGGDGSLIGDRWRSLLIVVPVFLWISSAAATATANLVKILTAEVPSNNPPQLLVNDNECVDEEDGEVYDPSAGLLQRCRDAVPRFREHIPSARSVFFSVQMRVLVLLGCMWLLNILSPAYNTMPIPDGFTPHRAEESAVPT